MSEVRIVPIELSSFVWPYGSLTGERGVVVVYAIDVDDRWILFDTGIGAAHPDIAEYATTTRPVRPALAEAGVPAERIEAIVNCHLHFDHCGQNAAFPGVPIFAQHAEWQAAHEPDYTIPEWVDFDAADYRLIEGGAHLLPSVSILATPGHTPGHQALVVDGPEERVILAGQACLSPQEWLGTDTSAERERAWVPERYDASILLMRALDPDVVWFAHATDPWRKQEASG